MHLVQVYLAFTSTVSRECFNVVCKEATALVLMGSCTSMCTHVVLEDPWMQFHKGFNEFLVVRGNEIRNMKTNQGKHKHRVEEDSDKEQKKTYTTTLTENTDLIIM